MIAASHDFCATVDVIRVAGESTLARSKGGREVPWGCRGGPDIRGGLPYHLHKACSDGNSFASGRRLLAAVAIIRNCIPMDTAMSGSDGQQPFGSPSEPPESPLSQPQTRKTPSRDKSEREKRTYRACLHCRQRKSRCDL